VMDFRQQNLIKMQNCDGFSTAKFNQDAKL